MPSTPECNCTAEQANEHDNCILTLLTEQHEHVANAQNYPPLLTPPFPLSHTPNLDLPPFLKIHFHNLLHAL